MNALRHGLSTIHRANPACSHEIERLVTALCEGNENPQLRDCAIQVAEHQLVLRSARAQARAVVERLKDPSAVPLGRRNAATSQARALQLELDQACREHAQYPGLFFATGVVANEDAPLRPQLWKPAKDRSDAEAFRLALSELRKIQRYERRAWAGLKRAMQHFVVAQTYLRHSTQS
jgi:hypothetical protein